MITTANNDFLCIFHPQIMSFPSALLKWLTTSNPEVAAQVVAAQRGAAKPAAPAKPGKKATPVAAAAETPIVDFLRTWYAKKLIAPTSDSRLRFTVSGHECPVTYEALTAYANGKAYARAVKKHSERPFNLEEFSEYFGMHRRIPGKVFCHLTETTLNPITSEIEMHMKGEKFLTAKLKKLRENAKKAAARKLRTKNSAAALVEDSVSEDEDGEDEDEDDMEEGAFDEDEDEDGMNDDDEDDDDEEEDEKEEIIAVLTKKGTKGAARVAPGAASKVAKLAKPTAKPAAKPTGPSALAKFTAVAAKAAAKPVPKAAAAEAAPAPVAAKGGVKRAAEAAAPVKKARGKQ